MHNNESKPVPLATGFLRGKTATNKRKMTKCHRDPLRFHESPKAMEDRRITQVESRLFSLRPIRPKLGPSQE